MDARSLNPQAQEAVRRSAVAAVRRGASKQSVARTLGVSRQAVILWCQAEESGGPGALAPRKRGPKPGRGLLNAKQAAIAQRTILGKLPDQLRLPFALWTRASVQAFLAHRFGVKMSLVAVGNYLRAWRFTPQKPIRRAVERDPAAVARWMRVDYPALASRCKRSRGILLWADESGIRTDHPSGRTYGLSGQTPVIPATGRRVGFNMISAIGNRGDLSFSVFGGRFTATVFLAFLRRLIRHHGRKVFLVVDGHPVHRSRRVSDWVQQQSEHIELAFLPAYSPHLNPDEYLNNDVKTSAVRNRPVTSAQELKNNVLAHLRRRQRQPQVIANLFKHKDVRYAA
jgi:transposase